MQDRDSTQTTEKADRFRYRFAQFDADGWALEKYHLPIPYDLLDTVTDTGKKIAAWWDGEKWSGLRLKKKDKVVKWKRRKYENIWRS